MSCNSCEGYESNKCPDCQKSPDLDDAVLGIADAISAYDRSSIEKWINKDEGDDVDEIETEFWALLLEEGLSDFEDEIRHLVEGEF